MYRKQGILLFVCLCVVCVGQAEPDTSETDSPVFVVSKSQLNGNPDLTAGQLIMAMQSGLPFPEIGESYEIVRDMIEESPNQIIAKSADTIVVRVALKDSENTVQSKYLFKEGKLIKGPVISDYGK
jgi:hypothetical protein